MPKDLNQLIQRHHVIAKAKACCPAAKVIAEQVKVFSENAMSRTQVFEVVRKVKNSDNLEDNRGKIIHKHVRTEEELINEVKAFIVEDKHVEVAQLASVINCSTGTIFNILYENLGFIKMSYAC